MSSKYTKSFVSSDVETDEETNRRTYKRIDTIFRICVRLCRFREEYTITTIIMTPVKIIYNNKSMLY